jgi:TetR/AcrR family transcriptional repressor of nem operon
MGRLTKEAKAQNRQNILDAAGRRFRTAGVDGAGIDDLMKDAGMTRGGFYNHFDSKEDLAVAVFQQSFADVLVVLDEYLDPADPRDLDTFFADYLGRDHRDSADGGCPSAALVVDSGRHGSAVQQAYADGAEGFLSRFAAAFEARSAGRRSAAEIREMAIQAFSEMVGAMVLARAVRTAAPELSDELLNSVQRNLQAAES